MTNLFNYLEDGANYQAQATLAFLKGRRDIEQSWDSEQKRYLADIRVARWENCREQGYVVMLSTSDYSKQLNIAFFEHRNSDSIDAVRWEQKTLNTPTIENAEFGDIYQTKWDTSYSVGYGEALEMANWIYNELTSFWVENNKSK